MKSENKLPLMYSQKQIHVDVTVLPPVTASELKLKKISRLASLTAGLALFASSQVLADTINFRQSTYDYNELSGTVQLQVDVTFQYGGDCSYQIPVYDSYDTGEGIISGTAQSGVDYTLPPTTLTFTSTGAGSTATAAVTLDLVNDGIPES